MGVWVSVGLVLDRLGVNTLGAWVLTAWASVLWSYGGSRLIAAQSILTLAPAACFIRFVWPRQHPDNRQKRFL
jgi:hypothetical protein